MYSFDVHTVIYNRYGKIIITCIVKSKLKVIKYKQHYLSIIKNLFTCNNEIFTLKP